MQRSPLLSDLLPGGSALSVLYQLSCLSLKSQVEQSWWNSAPRCISMVNSRTWEVTLKKTQVLPFKYYSSMRLMERIILVSRSCRQKLPQINLMCCNVFWKRDNVICHTFCLKHYFPFLLHWNLGEQKEPDTERLLNILSVLSHVKLSCYFLRHCSRMDFSVCLLYHLIK